MASNSVSRSRDFGSRDTLADAVRQFQGALTPAQHLDLLAQSTKPDAASILAFTAEVDRVNANRRARCVSSRLFGILQSVQDFSRIADTFVSAHPEVAALVLGSVKATILLVNNVVSFFDKLSDCFLRLGSCCPRYTEYQLLFGDSTRLQRSLCEFYATIVIFCTKAIQAIQNPGTTLAKAVWLPFEKEFGPFEEELKKRSKDVREEIRLAGEQAAAREREAAAQHRSSALRFRKEVKQISKDTSERRILKDQQRARIKREKWLDKLSTHDYMSGLKRVRRKRYKTTSSWIGDTEEFTHWLENKESGTLWLSGIVGSGKSVATAAVVDDLLCRSRERNEFLAFYFCEFDNNVSLSARVILGCLIRQCLSPDTLVQEVEHQLEAMFDGTSPDVEDLENLFQSIAITSGTIILVIDGFDECSQNDRTSLLGVLHRLQCSKNSSIKVFLSSRQSEVQTSGKIFDGCRQLKMNCEEAKADIATYVEDIIKEKQELNELVVGDASLVSEICEALVEGADGMFLWVAFQLNDICRQRSDANIRKCIAALPKGLPQTYERILTRIIEEGEDEIVDKIFRWVAAAKRPLLLEELREAIAVEPGDQYLVKDRLVNDIDGMIAWCCDLVTLDEEDLLVQFTHHSVKQFLLSKSFNHATQLFHFEISDVDHWAGEICVTYLDLNDFKRQVIKLPKPAHSLQPEKIVADAITGQGRLAKVGLQLARHVTKRSELKFDVMQHLDYVSGKDNIGSLGRLESHYSFLSYASGHWLSHTTGFSKDRSGTWNLWRELLLDEHPLALKPWSMDNENVRRRSIVKYIMDENHYALLHSLAGNGTLTKELYIDIVNELLITASKRGHTQLVDIIINLRISFTIIAQALIEAAEAGHLEVVDRLLAAEADVNANGLWGWTALRVAAGEGHLAVVERLLAAKADVDAVDLRGWTALRAAAGGGHLAVVERLLAAKADVNAVDSWGWTVLRAAAGGGHLAVVERLLAAGADVNATDFDGGTALITAAGEGYLEVAERLLAAKADVNAVDSWGWTVLRAAAGGGHLAVVERLLAAGADVNATDLKGRTALRTAAGEGYLEVAERLLAAKADVNAAGSGGSTALKFAKRLGNIQMVNLFKAAGAKR